MNVSKNKVIVVSRNGGYSVNVQLNGVRMEQVDCFRYLVSGIHESEEKNEEFDHRVRR